MILWGGNKCDTYKYYIKARSIYDVYIEIEY